MKKRWVSLLLATGMLLSSLTGCGSGNTSSGTSSAGGEKTASDSLNVAVSTDFQNIVPLSNNTYVANKDGEAIYSLYDPLIWRDPLTGELQPALAESWEVSEDGLEYTLKLRKDVTFHNGDSFDANDAAWTLELIHENPIISTQNFPTYESTEVVDDHTIIVHLSAPFAPMLNALASYHIVMLSKDYFDEVGWDGYMAKPVGTGPYSFVSRTMGSELSLTRYDDYWNGKANIANVRFLIMPDANAQMIALESGEIDAVVNANIQNIVNLNTERGVKWDFTQSDLTCIAMFNGNNEIMNDENLRKAILAGINYEGINKGANQGYTEKANAICNPGITARPADDTFTESIQYDAAAAAEYLAQSGYTKGTSLRILCIAGSKEENVAKIIQGDLANIGITAEVVAADAANYGTLQNAGDYEFYLYSMMPSLFDMNLLFQMFDPGSKIYPALFPQTEYLSNLGRQALSEMDGDARCKLYAEMCDIINKEAYHGYLYYDCSVIAYNEKLQNVTVLPNSNYRVSEWAWAGNQ